MCISHTRRRRNTKTTVKLVLKKKQLTQFSANFMAIYRIRATAASRTFIKITSACQKRRMQRSKCPIAYETPAI